jgi:HEAT repeat protein
MKNMNSRFRRIALQLAASYRIMEQERMQARTRILHLSTLAALVLSVGIFSLSFTAVTFAQNPTPPPAAPPPAQTPPVDTDTDVTPTDRLHNTIAQNTQEAWDMLTNAANDPKHPDVRIQALAALGTLGVNAQAETLIVAAMKDPDVDVRTASVLAAGQTKNRNLTTNLRNMLDDKEPQVAFASATTLWKMNDRSGEDILIAVVDGDRKATAGLKDSTMHTMNKDLHSPSTMARLGALQAGSMLLGPFGIGIGAYEYMHKNGGNSARVTAIEQISEEKTDPIRANLLSALGDKDPAVRAAAAKALGTNYHDKAVSDALLPVFDDTKKPVRLTAAAAYINSTTPAPKPAPRARSTPKKQ